MGRGEELNLGNGAAGAASAAAHRKLLLLHRGSGVGVLDWRRDQAPLAWRKHGKIDITSLHGIGGYASASCRKHFVSAPRAFRFLRVSQCCLYWSSVCPELKLVAKIGRDGSRVRVMMLGMEAQKRPLRSVGRASSDQVISETIIQTIHICFACESP